MIFKGKASIQILSSYLDKLSAIIFYCLLVRKHFDKKLQILDSELNEKCIRRVIRCFFSLWQTVRVVNQ